MTREKIRSTAATSSPVSSERDVSATIDSEVLRQAIACARDGVSISDARRSDMPLIYVNPAFEQMTGFSASEVLGRNCRFLQGVHTQQPELATLRDALATAESCIVTLRNYRKDGVLFYNELSMSPIHDAHGEITHYIGIQKDVTRRVRAELRLAKREEQLRTANAKLAQLAQRDGLTGLFNRRTIEEAIDREWRRALRDQQWLSLYMIDIDNFKAVNDQFGHAAGDQCIRRLGKVLEHCFARGCDFVGRYGGDEFVVLSAGFAPEQAAAQGRRLVASMHMAELPAGIDRLTISAGVASVKVDRHQQIEQLLVAADKALYQAKADGRDRLAVAPVLPASG